MRQWIDFHIAFNIADAFQTGKRVGAINIHRARATNSLAARPAKRKAAVFFIFDFDQHNLAVLHHFY